VAELPVPLLQRDLVGVMLIMKSKVLHGLMIEMTGAEVQGAVWTEICPEPAAAAGNKVLHSVRKGLLVALSA